MIYKFSFYTFKKKNAFFSFSKIYKCFGKVSVTFLIKNQCKIVHYVMNDQKKKKHILNV